MRRSTRVRVQPNLSTPASLPHDLPAPYTSRNLQPRSVSRTTSSAPSASRSAPGSSSSSRSKESISTSSSELGHLGDLRPRDGMQRLWPAGNFGRDEYGTYISDQGRDEGPSDNNFSFRGRQYDVTPQQEQPLGGRGGSGAYLAEQVWHSESNTGNMGNNPSLHGGYHEEQVTQDPSYSQFPTMMQESYNGPTYSTNTMGESSRNWNSVNQTHLQGANVFSSSASSSSYPPPSYPPPSSSFSSSSSLYAPNYEYNNHGSKTRAAGMGMGMDQWPGDPSNAGSTYYTESSSLGPQSSAGPSRLSSAAQQWTSPQFDIDEFGPGQDVPTSQGPESSRSSGTDRRFLMNEGSSPVNRWPQTEAGSSSDGYSSFFVESPPEQLRRANLTQELSINPDGYQINTNQILPRDTNTSGHPPGYGIKRKRSPDLPIFSHPISPTFPVGASQVTDQSVHQRPDVFQAYAEPSSEEIPPKTDPKGKGKARASPVADAVAMEITDSPPALKATANASKAKAPPKKPAGEPLSSYTCPICFSPPTNATMTLCGHICCGACLFAAVKTTMQRSAMAGPRNGPGEPRCPVCRAIIVGWDGKGGGVIGLKARAKFSL